MPSPWVQRLVNENRAASVADSTLGDRVAADKLIVVSDSDAVDFDPYTGNVVESDWTGTADYWHSVRRGLGFEDERVQRSIHDEEVNAFRERAYNFR